MKANALPLKGEVITGHRKRLRWMSAASVVLGFAVAGLFAPFGSRSGFGRAPESVGRPMLTFNKDIAPIVFNHCSVCHRPGQSAPFTLLTYNDVRKRAKQISEVTQRRYMPPWLPEPGFGEFADERRLSDSEIGLIREWATQGAAEGDPADLPALPEWKSDWVLGVPDLVLELPKQYSLPADGRDVYRNFDIPVGILGTRYVRAVEFRPVNPKIVHHAFIKVDRTRQSRRLDGQDGQPGFPGMSLPDGVEMPEGHFLAWQPGKVPHFETDGLAWRLEQDSDLVLQVHLRPSGKTEPLQCRIGLYFTEKAPTRTCTKLALVSLILDIPPGEQDYKVNQDFVLPVDVQVLGVLPHAHYLCNRMEGFASLPDGTKQWLLLIKDWDFNWQGDYEYHMPMTLPRGTTLSMRYTYDNSSNNVRNPNMPPKRVTYGAQSSDEMAELWLQVLPVNPAESNILAEAYAGKLRTVVTDYNEYLVRTDPTNANAHSELGFIRFTEGKMDEALRQLHMAVELAPNDDRPHYRLGLVFRYQKQLNEAEAEFETALKLNPSNYDAHGNLGVIFAEQGKLELAEKHLRSALRINPDDPKARELLDRLLRAEARSR